jgi:poly(3-hydroxybutyrate) depolymerase
VLYTFFHGVAPRSFGFVLPPDWFDHVESGNLALVVALHGGNQDITDFMNLRVQIDKLLTGVMHAGEPVEKQKLVAIFPVGLHGENTISGSWRSGHVGGQPDPIGNDDVSFVFACIDLVDQMLVRELKRLLGLSVESVFHRDRRFIMGFSNGAAMVGRVLARRPGWFRAAAMHSHVFSGYKHVFLMADAANLEANVPSPNEIGLSLMHLVGDSDGRVLASPLPQGLGSTGIEGTPPETTASIDLHVGLAGARTPDQYYRYDLSIDSGVDAWAAAIGAAPGIWQRLDDPTGARVGRERILLGATLAGEPAAVHQVVILGLDHNWWYPSDTFNATRLFWDFFQTWGPAPP